METYVGQRRAIRREPRPHGVRSSRGDEEQAHVRCRTADAGHGGVRPRSAVSCPYGADLIVPCCRGSCLPQIQPPLRVLAGPPRRAIRQDPPHPHLQQLLLRPIAPSLPESVQSRAPAEPPEYIAYIRTSVYNVLDFCYCISMDPRDQWLIKNTHIHSRGGMIVKSLLFQSRFIIVVRVA